MNYPYLILACLTPQDHWRLYANLETEDPNEAFRNLQLVRREWPESESILVDTLTGKVLAS